MKLKRSIRTNLIFSLSIPGFILLTLVVSIAVFSSLYITYNDSIYLYLLISLSVSLFILFVFVAALTTISLYKVYYKGLYQVTANNLDTIYRNRVDFVKYPKDLSFKELKELNKQLDKIQNMLQNSTIVSNQLDYNKLDFDYEEGFDRVVTFKSFRAQMENLILLSKSFRNVLFEIYYEINEELTNEEIEKVVSLFRSHFDCYSNLLFALNRKNNSIFLYIPVVDTLSRLLEQLTTIVQSTSIIRKTVDGLLTYNARFAVVAYPYSKAAEMFHDLNYAKRDNKTISTFFPKRLRALDDNIIKNESVNLNVISSIMETLAKLKPSTINKFEYKTIIDRSIQSLFAYFNVDEAGLILKDGDSLEYESSINYSSDKSSLFKSGNIFDEDFISCLNEVIDSDNSYYFSTRRHVNKSLGRYFDRYSITSGFYYVLKDFKGNVNSIFYLFRKNKDFVISSYLREGLILYSDRVMSFIENYQIHIESTKLNEVIKNILMLTQYSTYKVDKYTYEIKSFSRNITSIFKGVKKGELCYKAIFGLDKPCDKCPLATGKKAIQKYNKLRFEASLNLNKDNRSRYANVLLKVLEDKEDSQDRFNKDFLIHSFPALVEQMQNCYSMNGKGYLLLLKIDNIMNLVDEYGSEKTSVALRTFLGNVKEIFGNAENIYYFNSQTFAILFQEAGQIDVINNCEKIYEISKQDYFEDNSSNVIEELMITYLPMIYPSSYPSSKDFLKNTQMFFDSNKYETYRDYIYFEENEYIRPASKKDFMLSVIDDKFGNSTFMALLQPYLDAGDRKIIGVEMLLRLQDDYRNIIFNPNELISIAAKNGKMQVISDALIRFAGNLYQKQGSSLFKTFGLKRFSINIDYSYFIEESAISHLISLIKEFNLPDDFLVFEIPEKDISEHYEDYRNVISSMKKVSLTFVCDQYVGDILTLEKLKDIGFNEIKVSRKLISTIDSDLSTRNALDSISKEAKELNMPISVVGIDNNNQYEIVKAIDDKIMVQGFYFFKPLDKNALINALRTSNTR